jgi:putative transcriptional regulator
MQIAPVAKPLRQKTRFSQTLGLAKAGNALKIMETGCARALKRQEFAMRHALTSKLLVASPTIGDPRFAGTVIYMCSHSDEHGMGLVINKPMGALVLPELLSQIGIESSILAPKNPVLRGGPVDQARGFVLHTDDYKAEDSTHEIAPGISITATKEVLNALASDTPPERAVLALGYAAWGPGQLEDELMGNVWLIADADPEIIFDTDLDTKWTRALNSIGVDPARLIHGGGHA